MLPDAKDVCGWCQLVVNGIHLSTSAKSDVEWLYSINELRAIRLNVPMVFRSSLDLVDQKP